MNNNIFINEAFTNAIQKYLRNKNIPNSKEFDSFFVIIIRILILIYGELDIINPYQTNNVLGFDENLKKYGLSDSLLKELKDQLLIYFQSENDIELLKISFLKIQKTLIEMFLEKKKHVLVSDEELKQFRELLYLQEDMNEVKKSLYEQLTPNSNEIANYLNSKLFEQKHNFNLTEYKDIALSKEAYQLAGYNPVEVMNMNEKEIENINNKVYHFFRIKDSDINKKGRLQSAIEYYKKYGNALTSGNGYVDILLLSGVIATGMMILIITLFYIMR